jgi:phosphate transport system substrate-binding protein
MRSTLHTLLAIALLLGTASAQSLNGAGATFPNPIYQKWFSDYHNANKNVTINYQSVGSGAGIAQLTAGTVDFGASDGPMTDEQLGKVNGKVFHIPTVLGAVVLTYNVPGVSSDLKFTPEAIAGIYLGKIKKWNDSELTKSNPGVKLPDTDIVVVHRSDGSGTTYIFTDYLSKVSQEWANTVKKGTSVNWPTGLGAKGNEGVSGQVKQTEGAIGYVELIYALSNKMSYGVVKNSSGNWVKASLESVTAAAASSKDMPDDFRVSITNAPGKEAYPISSFTWLLVPAKWSDASKEKAFVAFLNWMVDKGQTMTASLEYAPLPKNVATKVKQRIKEIQ